MAENTGLPIVDSWLWTRVAGGNAWPAILPNANHPIEAAYHALNRTQWCSAAAIADGQRSQLRTLLAHCYRHVPYYRDLFNRIGISPDSPGALDDVMRLPTLARAVFQHRHKEFISRALPAGAVATGASTTSGTIGVPVVVTRTNVVDLWWYAFYLRDLAWGNIDPRGSLAIIRSVGGDDMAKSALFREGVTFPSWGPQLRCLMKTGHSFVMDIHNDPMRQLHWLSRIKPDYLLSYPSNIECLAAVMESDRLHVPSIGLVQCIAETLTERAQSRIESAFQARCLNLYSCVEAGYLASDCPEGHGMHVHAENVLLEVLDPHGQACRPGETGRVVLTTLRNFHCPLVRYEIGDEAEVGPRDCPCGRGLPLIRRVLGKARPMLSLPDGRLKKSNRLVESVRAVVGIAQHQIVQKTRQHIVVRIVPGPEWTHANAAGVRASVERFFEAPVQVDLEVVARIPIPPGGKLVDVVTEVDRDTAIREESSLASSMSDGSFVGDSISHALQMSEPGSTNS